MDSDEEAQLGSDSDDGGNVDQLGIGLDDDEDDSNNNQNKSNFKSSNATNNNDDDEEEEAEEDDEMAKMLEAELDDAFEKEKEEDEDGKEDADDEEKEEEQSADIVGNQSSSSRASNSSPSSLQINNSSTRSITPQPPFSSIPNKTTPPKSKSNEDEDEDDEKTEEGNKKKGKSKGGKNKNKTSGKSSSRASSSMDVDEDQDLSSSFNDGATSGVSSSISPPPLIDDPLTSLPHLSLDREIALLSRLSTVDQHRYYLFRSTHLSVPSIKRFLSHLLSGYHPSHAPHHVKIPSVLPILMSGVGKIFVGQLVEEAVRVKKERGERERMRREEGNAIENANEEMQTGAGLRPSDLREAMRRWSDRSGLTFMKQGNRHAKFKH